MQGKWFSYNRTLYITFIIGWLLLNLLQAWISQLHYDEAYYWIYSHKLDWGYFDHPPMVALLIKLGYSVFKNELGVRLLFVFMGTATLIMILYLIKETEKIQLLILFLLSITLLHVNVCGFMATPDTPLVFFATLFFITYREFIKKESSLLSIAIGFIASAMLYSKYHGVLILGLTLLSNIKILKNKKSWIAIFIIVFLMVPHLLWQIRNQFPTMNYQFLRRLGGIDLQEPVNYILSQLVVFGLLTGSILIYLAIVYKPADSFENTIKWNILGFFLFFLLFSLKTEIEAHWTAAIIPPLAFISFKSIREKERLLKWFKPLAVIGIVLLFGMRIIIANDTVANLLKAESRFNNWKQFADKTKKIANGRDIIFISSYKRPAEYSFYSGQIVPSVAKIGYRYSYYDFDHLDDSCIGKNVIFIEGSEISDSFYIGDFSYKLYYLNIPRYISYHHLDLKYSTQSLLTKCNDTIILNVAITNLSDTSISLNENSQLLPQICYEIIGDDYNVWCKDLKDFSENDTIRAGKALKMSINIQIPGRAGDYSLRFHVAYGDKLRGSSGKAIKIKVEP